MGLLEEIEETKIKLAEALEAEKEAEKEPEEEIVEETGEEAAPEEEKPAETVDAEPVVENPTAADFARMRREKKAKEREADDLRRQLEEAKKPVEVEAKEETIADPEPDRQTKYEAWLEWNLRQLKGQLEEVQGTVKKTTRQTEDERMVGAAVQEFTSYEHDFRAIEPTYDQAAEFYTKRLGDSIKMLNPNASAAQIGNMIQSTVLQKAAGYAKRGLDPAEELYNEAKSFGFAPKSDTEPVDDEPKIDLKKVSANRARNAGTAGASGRSGQPQVTREVAASYSPAEWVKLPISERRRLLGVK